MLSIDPGGGGGATPAGESEVPDSPSASSRTDMFSGAPVGSCAGSYGAVVLSKDPGGGGGATPAGDSGPPGPSRNDALRGGSQELWLTPLTSAFRVKSERVGEAVSVRVVEDRVDRSASGRVREPVSIWPSWFASSVVKSATPSALLSIPGRVSVLDWESTKTSPDALETAVVG